MSLARVLRLAVIFGLALHVTDGRAEFDVGRVKLRLSEDAWESVGTTRRTVPYTGDRSGEIPYVTRYLVLRNEAGKFRAALVVGASWGVGSVRMTWLQNCRSQQNVYAIDNARGNLNLRDCLRVTGRISPQRYLETTAREMLPDLSARNVAPAGRRVCGKRGNRTRKWHVPRSPGDLRGRFQAADRCERPSGDSSRRQVGSGSLGRAARQRCQELCPLSIGRARGSRRRGSNELSHIAGTPRVSRVAQRQRRGC